MNFKEKKLAIVILSYNTKKLLKNCLDGLTKQIGKENNPEIIVVDNGSTDGSKKMINDQWPMVKLIANDRNLGFCAGNNVGIRYALAQGHDYIMILNSDTIIKDAFWEFLVDFLEKNKEVGIVTPKIYFAPGHEYHKKRYSKSQQGKVIWSAGGVFDWDNVIGANRGVDDVDQGQYDQPAEVDFVSGCCLLARTKVWQQANFLDEKYFMYYEDTDFCQKAKRAGWKVFCIPGSCLYHLNAGSSQVGGSLQDYFITRNRLLFGLRFAPLRARLALIRESGRLLISGRKWQKQGTRDFYLRRFGRGSWK